jgi:hypothetical protein
VLKVFELCLSSPTVSNFFTLLFLPFSTVSEPFHRWGGAFQHPRGTIWSSVQKVDSVLDRTLPWRTVLHRLTLLPGLLHCVCCARCACLGCCTMCSMCSMSRAVLPMCVLCCACVCAYVVVYPCVFCFSVSILVIFLALIVNDPPFYWLF